ncbi:MAG: PEP-CTERM sorting domain-containing protein [Chthoniobacteraceae bacterium]
MKVDILDRKLLPTWHATSYFARMTRRLLLTASVVTAVTILSPSAFSAAVVVGSDGFISPKAAASGKVILRRDIDRLFAGTRADVISAPLSLASHRAGSLVTLTGVNAVEAGSEETLPADLANLSGLDETIFAVTVPNLNPAPAVPENVGSASSFAAVPEPCSIALLAMGAFAFLRRRRG